MKGKDGHKYRFTSIDSCIVTLWTDTNVFGRHVKIRAMMGEKVERVRMTWCFWFV